MLLFVAALLTCKADPVYTLVRVPAPVRIERNGPMYRAVTRLSFRVTPRLRPPHTRDAGFNDHVRGRQIIAQRVAGSSNGEISAGAKSERDARAQLRRALNQMTADAQKELMREERVYDSVTEDGMAQDQGPTFGLPGGRNAHDRCPQP